jgi:hypothetical protein
MAMTLRKALEQLFRLRGEERPIDHRNLNAALAWQHLGAHRDLTQHLDNPMVKGALLEVLRWATKDPALYVLPSVHEEEGIVGWDVRQPLLYGSRSLGNGDTEGGALGAAVVAFAEAL